MKHEGKEFQFLYGTIKSVAIFTLAVLLLRFNSSTVQLKVLEQR